MQVQVVHQLEAVLLLSWVHSFQREMAEVSVGTKIPGTKVLLFLFANVEQFL